MHLVEMKHRLSLKKSQNRNHDSLLNISNILQTLSNILQNNFKTRKHIKISKIYFQQFNYTFISVVIVLHMIIDIFYHIINVT